MWFAASVAGRFARQALGRGEGTVCAVFRRSFYLESATGYACVGDASLGHGPLNALVADFREPALRQTVTISLDRCESWEPAAFSGGARPQLDPLRACLDGHVPEEGLGCTILGVHNALSVHAQPALEAIDRWLAGNALSHEAAQLIGLGPGLTPSGDDYFGGILVALRWLGRGTQTESLWRWLEPRLAGRTNPISAAHLAAAAAGQVHEALHEVLDDLSAWQVPDLHARLARLDGVGHTSGWDALAGVVAVARYSQ